MIVFLMIIHIIISGLLVLSILVQSSKGGALDGLVGGAATNALGGQGASRFMKQATIVLAVIFTISCVVFALYLRDARPGSSKAVDMLKKEAQQTAPAETEALPEAPIPAESE